MIRWEKIILDTFIEHYFSSAAEDRSSLRLRSSVIFPGFDSAHHDEKESYLEAAESLEKKGIIKLSWEKPGDRLKTMSFENFEKLFAAAKKPYPKTEIEKIRLMLDAEIQKMKNEKTIDLLEFISGNIGPRDFEQGIDQDAVKSLIRLLEFYADPSRLENITPRALSILLFQDSKYLENLPVLYKPLLSRAHAAQKPIPVPDFSFLERSFPETLLSGKIIIEYKNQETPQVNAGGHILGLPLRTVAEIISIQPVLQKKDKTVLTIENKETFYALASPQKNAVCGEGNLSARFDCFLYAGGYSNRAAAAIITTLASSGFSFYHAGDLDPDGILILQQIRELAGKPVMPLKMDAAVFDRYCQWGRTLTKPMLQQLKKIDEETKAVPELAALIRRIEETGLGVEQEIIDYR